MPDLICLAGYGRTGKDSVGRVLVRRGYVRVSIADPIRGALYRLNPSVFAQGVGRRVPVADLVDVFGWEGVKRYPEVRELLQRLGGVALKPVFGDDCWLRVALGSLSGPSVITDARLPIEFDAVRAAGGEVWRVHRHGVGPANDHETETAMDSYHGFDWHVWNNGTLDDLRAQVLAAVP